MLDIEVLHILPDHHQQDNNNLHCCYQDKCQRKVHHQDQCKYHCCLVVSYSPAHLLHQDSLDIRHILHMLEDEWRDCCCIGIGDPKGNRYGLVF